MHICDIQEKFYKSALLRLQKNADKKNWFYWAVICSLYQTKEKIPIKELDNDVNRIWFICPKCGRYHHMETKKFINLNKGRKK